jgi:hypothetical protein
MRLRAWLTVALCTGLFVGACSADGGHCLNPQPDLPCLSQGAPGTGGTSVAGATNGSAGENTNAGGSPGSSGASASGGASSGGASEIAEGGMGGEGLPEAGASGEEAGAGGESGHPTH